jgi:hypothetical protein
MCASPRAVCTIEQAAAAQGVSVAELSRSDARWWLGDGQHDLVGPRFASTWGGSDEEKAEAERVAAYQEAQRLKVRASEHAHERPQLP